MLQGGEKKMFMPSLRGAECHQQLFLETGQSSHLMDNINRVFFFNCFVYYYLATVLSLGKINRVNLNTHQPRITKLRMLQRCCDWYLPDRAVGTSNKILAIRIKTGKT